MDRPASNPLVQRTLAWSLATKTVEALGPQTTISHWFLQIYHGLFISVGQKAGVVITYNASIHVYPADGPERTIPNLWTQILDGLPLKVVASDLAGQLIGRGAAESNDTGRNLERRTAYRLIAAMTRYSLQRGLGWVCDSPDSEGWGLNQQLIMPYEAFTHISASQFPEPPGIPGYPAGSDYIADWSFIRGPSGPVCCIDPEHKIMFTDGTVWNLPDLADTEPWKVAAGIARKTGAPTPPGHSSSGLLQHAISTHLDDHDLLRHEALGGRIADDDIYGPTPVLKPTTRTHLQKVSGRPIPATALVLHGPTVKPVLSGLSGNPGKDSALDDLDFVVVWPSFTHNHSQHPPGLLVVVDAAAQPWESSDLVLHLAQTLGVEATAISAEGITRDLPFSWELRQSQRTVSLKPSPDAC